MEGMIYIQPEGTTVILTRTFKIVTYSVLGLVISTPRLIPENRNICSHINLYMNVYSSVTHNSPKVETIQIPSIDEWINKM